MVDIETHAIVDMIESREYDDVVTWLRKYPNIKLFSRDGSITYNNAIKTSHPDSIQVSDRFHILKNLTSYCKEYLSKYLKNRIPIKLSNKQKSNTKLDDKNKKIPSTSIKETNNNEKINRKQKLIYEARMLHKKGLIVSKIAKELCLDRRTINKYLDENTSAVNLAYRAKRGSKLNPFLDTINNGIINRLTYRKIEEIIILKGYNGSSSLLRNYISNWKKNNSNFRNDFIENEITIIEKQSLIKLLYSSVESVKEISKEVIKQVFLQYPALEKILKLVNEFRNILTTKTVSKLDTWIENVLSLNIRELNSFVNGIKRDNVAVKNAIYYDYNNGLAEGSVNKIKVIKRIMYGRCNFNTLKNKVLKLEYYRKFN